ncbi:MAG: efflux RND transporter permease subunit [Thermoanaerobaculia bacterium]|nr:efflux RND transporter permease subunit [Thermoanaerobaculia bacterium]
MEPHNDTTADGTALDGGQPSLGGGAVVDTAGDGANPIVRFAVERRVTMAMLLAGVLVMGWLSVTRLPLEFLPTISSSNVWVSAPYPASSPEEVERRIVRPLEDAMGTLENVDRMSATASSGEGNVSVEFADGTDMDQAIVEVRDRVDRVRHRLPDDLERINIRRFQTSDLPILRFHLSSDWPNDDLLDFTERVMRPRLERRAGVAQVQVRGLQTRQIQIRLDPARMAAHGIDVRQLQSTLRQSHLDLSAGHVDTAGRRWQLRVLGQLKTLDDLSGLPVLGAEGGIRLGDVADVELGYPEQNSFNFLNGSEALQIRVYKASDANLLDVIEGVKEELALLAADPRWAGHHARIYADASADVKKGLAQLRNAGLVGGGLAIFAVFFFLRRFRTTLLVGIAVPVSVVCTFVLMFLLRQTTDVQITLNVVSLMGLVIALGMLVDNSIVVIESIYRRIEIFGEDARSAALRGASDVALPILASTATTLCVFIPVIFLRSQGGFFGRYIVEIGTTVCIVMVASLLVALTVVPMVAARLLGSERPTTLRFFQWMSEVYGRVLGATLRFRFVFLVLALGILWGSWTLFMGIERTFMGRTQERQLTINVDTPRNYSLHQTQALFDEVREVLLAHKEDLDMADLTSSYVATGGRLRGRSNSRSFDLYLVDESEAELTTGEVRDKVRALLPRKAGVEFKLTQERRNGPGSNLEVELSGDEMSVLELLGRDVASQMERIEGLKDVDLSLESGEEQLLVEADRDRLALAGLSTESVARTVQTALSDRPVSYVATDDREVEIVMSYEGPESATLRELRNVEVHGDGGAVPLDTLATFRSTPGPRSIERENRRAKIHISADASDPMAMGMAMRGVGSILGQTSFPAGYSWSFGRWTRRGQQDEEGAAFTLLFAMLLVYLLMASLFESFGHPLSIMMSVPFAFVGVGVVMRLAGQPRDTYTELGLIVLIGVVVNNAIVLVDHINRLRREGLDRTRAIRQGGRDRLRAILMTAVTTIVGLLPMVAPILFPSIFGPLEGRSATWAPVGLVILGGLTTSTFLTLLVVPTVYSVVDDVGVFCRRVLAHLAYRRPSPAAESPTPLSDSST